TTAAPLWNHALTAATFTMYSANGSTTLDGTEDPQPTGASKLCLSCHDGTVGLDNFGGGPNTFGPLDPTNPFYVGTDLQGQHPISITYEDTQDPGLHDPTNPVTIGGYTPPGGTPFPSRTGTIASMLIPDGKVQCNSCHDVHNTFVATSAAMLRIDMANSTLCLTCHNK
ncbi:MAG: cytochrome c3 family protein, partial [Candidatus Thiodiazotropha sp.]